jgi:hypothetical protein
MPLGFKTNAHTPIINTASNNLSEFFIDLSPVRPLTGEKYD